MMNVWNVEPGAALDEKPDNIRMASPSGLMQRRGMRCLTRITPSPNTPI